jgi:predicted membrane-bound spermidine synthase
LILESEPGRRHAFTFGVATIAFATIALELLLTRIYSVTMYYHFAFMVISLALLGLAIAGVATYLLPRLFRLERAGELAGLFGLLFAIGAAVTLKVSVSRPIDAAVSLTDNIQSLLVLYFAAAVPFLMSGFALTVAIASAGERIGRIYAFDLCGAAAGCLFVIPTIAALGGPGAILVVAAVGALGAAAFALSAAPGRRLRLPLAGAGVVVAAVLAVLGVTESTAQRFAFTPHPGKMQGKRQVLFEEWNAFSRITVTDAGWPSHRWIFIDGDAATRLWSGDGPETPRRGLDDVAEIRVAALVYALRSAGPALIIGPGGGTDVRSALRAGVPRVVGVEVNPIIVDDVVKGAFAEYGGDLYRDPRVEVVVDEGRSYIRRSGERYSSIQATLVDTWAASSSGAFSLSENNLYTVEAFGEFLDHLQPGGVLAVTRWYDAGRPREFLRLTALARAALERRGVDDPARHVLIAEDGERRGTVLVSRDPYSDGDVDTFVERAAAGKLRLLHTPGGEHDNLISEFLRAPDAGAFLDRLPYDATPTTDDRPFFFYTVRTGDFFSLLGKLDELDRNDLGLAILLILLVVSTGLTLLFVVLPLALLRRDVLRERRGPKLRVLGFFLCLGLGFILVELGFMQKFVLFLGHPIYALAVVLATLLAASGIGSALSGGLTRRFGPAGLARRGIAALAALMIVYALGLGPLFHALLGWPLAGRIALSIPLIALPGLLMGSLLPTGVRTANALDPELVPWAWGLNGATSVVGSILAITMSMNFGFTTTLFVGVAAYLVGLAALPDVRSEAPTVR